MAAFKCVFLIRNFVRLRVLKRCTFSTSAKISNPAPARHCESAAEDLSSTLFIEPSESSSFVGVVGLEIHAQILTASKLFSGSATQFSAPVNTQVSYFDAGHPGTLPGLNKRCVEAAIHTALALNCKINKKSAFDRKHYFYGDLPVGYQITQQRLPLAVNGELRFIVHNPAVIKRPYVMRSRIKQLQLEQDSGKSLHIPDARYSLIDLNRAGVPLMEIVFQPDLSCGEEAAALVKELHLILKRLRTCDCKMEEGSLRVDANVSVHKRGQPLGIRTEIKNLNSIRAVAKAIDYEIERQIVIVSNGGTVENETLTFDMKSKRTLAIRDKEKVQDYRFMPEPNLPPLLLCDDADHETIRACRINVDELRRQLPELPEQMRNILIEKHGLTLDAAVQLLTDENLCACFLRLTGLLPTVEAKKVFHFIVIDFLAALYKCDIPIQKCAYKPEVLAEVLKLKTEGVFSALNTQNLLELLLKGDQRSPTQIVSDNDWTQISDVSVLRSICLEVIGSNQKAVRSYQSGKARSLNTLLGEVQKAANDKANMSVATRLLKELLLSDNSS